MSAETGASSHTPSSHPHTLKSSCTNQSKQTFVCAFAFTYQISINYLSSHWETKLTKSSQSWFEVREENMPSHTSFSCWVPLYYSFKPDQVSQQVRKTGNFAHLRKAICSEWRMILLWALRNWPSSSCCLAPRDAKIGLSCASMTLAKPTGSGMQVCCWIICLTALFLLIPISCLSPCCLHLFFCLFVFSFRRLLSIYSLHLSFVKGVPKYNIYEPTEAGPSFFDNATISTLMSKVSLRKCP